jgi:hypothetical protein
MENVEFCLVSLFEEIKKATIRNWVDKNFKELEKCNSLFDMKQYYQHKLIDIKNDIIIHFILYSVI